MESRNKARTTYEVSPDTYTKFRVAVIRMQSGMSASQVLEFLVDDFLRNGNFKSRSLWEQVFDGSRPPGKKPNRTLHISRELHQRFNIAAVQMGVSMGKIIRFLIEDFIRNESPTVRFLRGHGIEKTGEEHG